MDAEFADFVQCGVLLKAFRILKKSWQYQMLLKHNFHNLPMNLTDYHANYFAPNSMWASYSLHSLYKEASTAGGIHARGE